MPKATRAKDTTTPKKPSRKAKPEQVVGTQAAEPVATTPAQTVEVPAAPVAVHTEPVARKVVIEPAVIEEKIRRRAYELYLQRDGQGGSPEQDWHQAAAEIRGQIVA